MTAVPTDPAASARAPVAHRRAARASVPGGPAASPRTAAGGKTPSPAGSPTPPPGSVSTSPQPRRERTAAGMPGPDTAAAPYSLRGQAAVRARPETPAGASGHDSPPAGSRGLSGAEWRAAAKAAQSKRRQPARSAAVKPAPLPPVTGGAALTAVATCLSHCDWTAGPGDPAEIDKAAENHATKPPKHPTNTVSVVAEIGGTA